MQCPECHSNYVNKNDQKKGKQNYICVGCGRQFIDCYQPHKGYSEEIKREYLKMYVNGMGFRASERICMSTSHQHYKLGIACRRIAPWCLRTRHNSPGGRTWWTRNVCWSKKNKLWRATAVNHFQPGILGWVLGDHSAITFRPLWALVGNWKCYFYITDGWPVYPMFIPDGDQIICKTYMTRIEGENTRLRHYASPASSQDTVLF